MNILEIKKLPVNTLGSPLQIENETLGTRNKYQILLGLTYVSIQLMCQPNCCVGVDLCVNQIIGPIHLPKAQLILILTVA